MSVRVIGPGAGEVVGDSTDRRVEILSDHPALHATWSRFGPGREGADLHVHREHTDCFFVLEGELAVGLGLGGEVRRVEAGQLVVVPPLVVHGFDNAGDAEVRYLNFHFPGCGFADFMRGLHSAESDVYDQFEPPPDGGRDPGNASVAAPRAPFSLIEVGSGDRLEPAAATTLRSIYVLDGELALGRGEQTAPAGSWIQLEGTEGDAVAAATRSALLVLDLEGPEV